MKITRVKTVVVNAEMRNWIFVKVETDNDGLFGWGEASLEWKTRSVVGAVDDLAPMIVGENPLQIEHLYQKMYRQGFWRLGITGMSALSGIELALWDIKGKHLGVALSTPNFLIQEDMLMDVPYRWDVVKSHLKTENGHWLPTEVPGLGIEVDEKEAAKYPFKQEIIHPLTIRAGDNSILDW